MSSKGPWGAELSTNSTVLQYQVNLH